MGRPPARRTDNFSKSDNNTPQQILAEGKNALFQLAQEGENVGEMHNKLSYS